MTEALPALDITNTGDMDTIAGRLIPFAPREGTREKLRAIAVEHDRRLANLNALFHGQRASCPLCGNNKNVTIIGSGRNGTKKFRCWQEHDLDELPSRDDKRDDPTLRFSTYTSYEALRVYQDFLVDALKVATLCGGTVEGLARLVYISRYMVELGTSAVVEHLKEGQGRGAIETDEDLVVIYADFSSTRVARSMSFIMARVAGEVVYEILPAVNWVTAWSFVKNIRRALKCPDDATIVWVTDGETTWVDPIRKVFPEAVHVRQFHKEHLRGLVYAHFPHGGERYTLRCLWDLVLNEGTPSERTQAMRRYRSAGKARKGEATTETAWTELYDGIILWRGTVYDARGARRRRARKAQEGATPSGALGAGTCGHEGREASDERPATARREDGATPEVEGVIAPEGDAPGDDGEKTTHEVVFRGPLQEGLGNEAIRYVHGILVRTFGGMYISSNKAEVLFEVKAPLKAHRTVRNGTRMILIVLHTWNSLRKLPREEIEAFLREAISLERLGRLVIKRDHRGWAQRDKHREVEAILSQAMGAREPVIIAYKDRHGRRTGRMIQPLAFKKNEYTGQTMLEAFCHLRDDERTFLVDRISDAMLDEPLLGIIS